MVFCVEDINCQYKPESPVFARNLMSIQNLMNGHA